MKPAIREKDPVSRCVLEMGRDKIVISLETPIRSGAFKASFIARRRRSLPSAFTPVYDSCETFPAMPTRWPAQSRRAGVDGITLEQIHARDSKHGWLAYDVMQLIDPIRCAVMIPEARRGERPAAIPTIRYGSSSSAKIVSELIFQADLRLRLWIGSRRTQSMPSRKCIGFTPLHARRRRRFVDIQTIRTRSPQSVVRSSSTELYFRLISHAARAVHGSDGNRRMSVAIDKRGTPQGGVISPLLSVVYMNRFLKHWRLSGQREAFHAQVISYADHFAILSRGHAEEALTWTKAVMTKLGLTLNETKTSVKNARLESFDFLGYTLGPRRFRNGGRWYLARSVQEKRAADQEEDQRTADAR